MSALDVLLSFGIAIGFCLLTVFFERWVQVRELMSIAKEEIGPELFKLHRAEIKWQCKIKARAIRAGMDAGTQRAALRSYLQHYCMADGYLREVKRHG